MTDGRFTLTHIFLICLLLTCIVAVSLPKKPQEDRTEDIAKTNVVTEMIELFDAENKTAIFARPKATQVAFSATSSSGVSAGAQNVVIKYDVLGVNIGESMDPTNGIFTVPVNGVYEFSFHFLTQNRKMAYVDLYYGSAVLAATGRGDENSSHQMGGNSVFLNLKIGDRVWLELRANGAILSLPTELYTTFNGKLL